MMQQLIKKLPGCRLAVDISLYQNLLRHQHLSLSPVHRLNLQLLGLLEHLRKKKRSNMITFFQNKTLILRMILSFVVPQTFHNVPPQVFLHEISPPLWWLQFMQIVYFESFSSATPHLPQRLRCKNVSEHKFKF